MLAPKADLSTSSFVLLFFECFFKRMCKSSYFKNSLFVRLSEVICIFEGPVIQDMLLCSARLDGAQRNRTEHGVSRRVFEIE